jgi:CrcB protein
MDMTVSHAIAVAAAGAVGTLARVAANEIAIRLLGPGFPWGTLMVNVAGSFCFGVVVAIGRDRSVLPPGLETIVLVGLLGGFTTFSSFAWQSVEMVAGGRLAIAAVYVALTNAAALAAAWAGITAAGRWAAGPG